MLLAGVDSSRVLTVIVLQEFRTLWHARQVFLGFFAGQELPLTPVLHCMTNEAVRFAWEDGTAYHTLQEAIEHANAVDKSDAKHTTHRAPAAGSGVTSWEQLLSNQLLRRHFAEQRAQPQALEQQTATSQQHCAITAVTSLPALTGAEWRPDRMPMCGDAQQK
jgi:hypothetical protein